MVYSIFSPENVVLCVKLPIKTSQSRFTIRSVIKKNHIIIYALRCSSSTHVDSNDMPQAIARFAASETHNAV